MFGSLKPPASLGNGYSETNNGLCYLNAPRSTRPNDSPHAPHGQASVNQGVAIFAVLLSGSAAVDPVQGYLVGRCDMDDVRGSRRAGAVAQRGGSGGAQGLHGAGRTKQGAANHAFNCPATAAATSRCQPSSCFRARGRGGAQVHDVPVGAETRTFWVVSLFSLFDCPCLFFCS